MSEQNHPIQDVLQTTMSKLREMVDANTVIGQPIATQDGVTLIPVSRLSFGFATGGSDFGKAPNVSKNFGGGAGAGVNVVPVAFLIVKGGSVKLLPVAPPSGDSVSRAVELVPEMFDRITGYLDRKSGDGPAEDKAD
ncbi:MAG TPA: GerW family sporulation protein [Candidatus Enterenecus merdae]|nr:GerW family sporulation protein [Candidatus Enterenecus merdae]